MLLARAARLEDDACRWKACKQILEIRIAMVVQMLCRANREWLCELRKEHVGKQPSQR